jgi:ribosome biogenesis protein MAK21
VAVQASELIALKLPISGSADISQNTLVSFLDRFVYRNPKKHATAKGASIMQPAAAALNGRAGAAVVVRSKGAKVAGDAAGYVNDEKFWKKKVEDVPADQVRFLRGCPVSI